MSEASDFSSWKEEVHYDPESSYEVRKERRQTFYRRRGTKSKIPNSGDSKEETKPDMSKEYHTLPYPLIDKSCPPEVWIDGIFESS